MLTFLESCFSRKFLKLCFASSLIALLSGCQSLFFWPSDYMVDSPKRFGFEYQDVDFQSEDNTRLHGWYLKADEQSKVHGTLYVLHGNGDNLSFHIAGLYWLVQYGWNIFIIDYRGYGWSEGEPSIDTVALDALAGYRWLEKNGDSNVIVFGQSLGGAVAIDMLHQSGIKPSGLILDSTFDSHRSIFREVIGKSWLLWPLQFPLSLGIPDHKAPKKLIESVKGVPTLLVHSTKDLLIDEEHSESLFELVSGEKGLWLADEFGHLTVWNSKVWRKKLVCQLKKWPELTDSETVCQAGDNIERTISDE